MRGLVRLIVGTGVILAAPSASAQMYDPNYPVCMEIHDGQGTRYDCFFTSMAQCKQGTQGMAGICFNNPRYVAPKAEAAPAAEPAPAPSPAPAKKKKH